MLAGCKFIVMKFCFMNKEKALWVVLAITPVFLMSNVISIALRYNTKTYTRL